MQKLRLKEKNGGEWTLGWLGWKDNLREFYVITSTRSFAVLSLVPAYPDDSETGESYRFPPVRPVEIAPIRLTLPPCVANLEEASKCWREALYPKPEDDEMLAKRLQSFREKVRIDRDRELAKADLAVGAELWPHVGFNTLMHWHDNPPPDEVLVPYRKQLKRTIESKYETDINSSLEDLKRGSTDGLLRVRDDYLINKWAKEQGIDLEAMTHARVEYEWQARRAYGDDWRYLGSNADAVAYQICCDKGVFFLNGFDVRHHLTPAEAADCKLLLETKHAFALGGSRSKREEAASALGVAKSGRRKAGRKREYDPQRDERLLKGWEAGRFKTYEQYASEIGMKCADAIKAMQRARHRRRSLRRARQ